MNVVAEARADIDWAENQIREVRAGKIDVAPLTPAQWEQQMRNRIEANKGILERHGSMYVMPSDLNP